MKSKITAAHLTEMLRCGPGRWLEWSAHLFSRVARLVGRREVPRMLFEEPGTPIETRLELHSRSFFASLIARLNLNFSWFRPWRASSGGGLQLAVQGTAPRAEGALDGPAFPEVSSPLVDRTPELAGEREVKGWVSRMPPPARSLSIGTWSRPWLLVPQRLPLAATPIGSDETPRLGRTVLARTVRVERIAQGQVRMRHRIDFHGEASAAPGERTAAEAAGRLRERLGAPVIPDPAIAMKMNVDQLTEEVIRRIDDRMRAHRERMGRVF